jgi:hypothetical protein
LAGKSSQMLVVQPIPGIEPYRYGAVYLSNNLLSDLSNAVNNMISSQLFEEVFSDAQAAAVEGNLRRAVLELAISCEIAVKQKFFFTSTPSGAAFEYLEDKGRV